MTSGSWVSCGQRVVWDMGRTLREPPYGLAEPFPIRVPAGSKHQKALERSGPITRRRTAQLRDSPLKETATPATEGGGSAFAFAKGAVRVSRAGRRRVGGHRALGDACEPRPL